MGSGENNDGKDWRRNKKKTAERGYGAAWQKARAAFLKKYPLCAYCEKSGVVKAACVVDHIRPHRGNRDLFWDSSNWQPLCKHCHDSVKQREEKGQTAFGEDGYPLYI